MGPSFQRNIFKFVTWRQRWSPALRLPPQAKIERILKWKVWGASILTGDKSPVCKLRLELQHRLHLINDCEEIGIL